MRFLRVAKKVKACSTVKYANNNNNKPFLTAMNNTKKKSVTSKSCID